MEVVFRFDVDKDKQDDFIEFVRTGTKPWWEANGCIAYTVWKVEGEETAFEKRMAWPDMETMKKVMPEKEKDPEGFKLIRKFGTFVKNATRTELVQEL